VIDRCHRPGTLTAARHSTGRAGAGEPRAAAGECDLDERVCPLHGGARPPTAVVVSSKDAHREAPGGRADLRTDVDRLEHLLRATGPADAATTAVIERVHAELRRQGQPVARCIVPRLARLMLRKGPRGIGRAKARGTRFRDWPDLADWACSATGRDQLPQQGPVEGRRRPGAGRRRVHRLVQPTTPARRHL
jgi:hypothetical protein